MSTATATAARAPAPPTAPFGTVFARRMAITWHRGGSWGPSELRDTGPIPMHPGAHVLHYSSACFEGLKAFRHPDGKARVFRLDRHVARMCQSARLLCLPPPDPAQLEAMVLDVVRECRDEIPAFPGALYLRPTLIGTEVNIGAAGTPPSEVCLYVLASPVGDYFGAGLQPVRVAVEDEHPRTTADFGMAKAGANYASALRHVMQARAEHEAATVLFCPGGDVQETGASNFMLLDDQRLVTKPLSGAFLHGVTRDSVLRLAAHLGYTVEERDFTVDEMLDWCGRGEAALSGTAAVLAGVGTLIHHGREVQVGGGQVGPNTRRLREALTAIQSGEAEDPFGWLREV
ncbi:MAG: branched-chain amino acid aminotransferase [Ectothiorhodospiraceae bacterium]|nr:branched-chain amino acid aminotransferase [Ectothiorhodospiraceae bacterium]